MSATFFSFVATHSAFELTAIVLSGAAGLRIGHSLLAPGQQPRRPSLVRAAQDTAVLLYGVVALLVVAAFVEAFWSSARWLPPAVKYAVAAICWTAVILYLTRQRPCDSCLAVRLRPRSSMEAADPRLRVPVCGAVRLPVVPTGCDPDCDPGRGFVRHRRLASDSGDLVAQTVAGPHHPVRALACGVQPADALAGSLGVAAAGVVRPDLLALTLQRLSFWRALTQPAYQLEGGGFWGRGAACESCAGAPPEPRS